MDRIKALEEYVKTLEGDIAEIEAGGTGAVNDVQVNGTSVVAGGVASVSVPTATSDLTNDSNYVVDNNYTHTDNNYTTTEKNKLAGIANGAEVNVQSDWNQTDTGADDYVKNKPADISNADIDIIVAS